MSEKRGTLHGVKPAETTRPETYEEKRKREHEDFVKSMPNRWHLVGAIWGSIILLFFVMPKIGPWMDAKIPYGSTIFTGGMGTLCCCFFAGVFKPIVKWEHKIKNIVCFSIAMVGAMLIPEGNRAHPPNDTLVKWGGYCILISVVLNFIWSSMISKTVCKEERKDE